MQPDKQCPRLLFEGARVNPQWSSHPDTLPGKFIVVNSSGWMDKPTFSVYLRDQFVPNRNLPPPVCKNVLLADNHHSHYSSERL